MTEMVLWNAGAGWAVVWAAGEGEGGVGEDTGEEAAAEAGDAGGGLEPVAVPHAAAASRATSARHFGSFERVSLLIGSIICPPRNCRFTRR